MIDINASWIELSEDDIIDKSCTGWHSDVRTGLPPRRSELDSGIDKYATNSSSPGQNIEFA